MATMYIYRGLPGSGKTTRALNNAQKDNGRVVGRDHIRQMLNIRGVGSRSQETEVTEIQERLIIQGLRSGQNVHVDDMNLKTAYVRRLIGLARREAAEYEIVDLTDKFMTQCQVNNALRDSSQRVPADLIADLHKRFVRGKGYPLPVPEDISTEGSVVPEPYVPNPGVLQAVLIDLDGTVALHEGIRGHHDYDKVHLDLPNNPVIEIIQAFVYQDTYKNTVGTIYPLFVSGRPDSCREATRQWISDNVGVYPYRLFMRKTGDTRPDWQVKLDIFDQNVRHKYNVLAAFDDRNQVVDMYRELGITVLQVAPGAF